MKQNQSTKNLCACYVRVSQYEQAIHGLSLKNQKERLTDYCKAKEWAIYKIYEDAGFSGGYTDRPALQELIKDAKEKKFNLILVYKIDRFSRDIISMSLILDELKQKYDIEFSSLTENIETDTAFGRFFMRMMILIAQLEREKNAERIRDVLEKKIEKKMPIIRAPFGYRYDKNKTSKTYKQWLVVPEKARIVKEIFGLKSNGTGVKDIAEKFELSRNYVYKILKNESYTGKISFTRRHKDREGKVYKKERQQYLGDYEPIISEELFKKVNGIT